MRSFSPLLDVLGQEILSKKGDDNVRGDSDVEGQVSDPEVGESFSLDGFSQGIENVLVGVLAIRAFLHLLKLGFGIVEGQAAKR
jgi:hypothetical protein